MCRPNTSTGAVVKTTLAAFSFVLLFFYQIEEEDVREHKMV